MRLALLFVCVGSGLGFSQSLHDERSFTGPTGPPPAFASGDVLQGPAPHFGLDPLGICLDPVGVVHGVPTLYVVDLYDGLTFLYDANDLSLLETIASPAGVTVVSGITTDGSSLYWVADETLYQTGMDGSSVATVGALGLPGGGIAGDCCLDAAGDLWVVDVTSDQYSRHSTTDGAYQGDTIASPSGVDAFGTGIAFRSDCAFFEIPHGAFSSGQVTTLSVVDTTGVTLDSFSIAPLGAFASGIAVALPSPSFGIYSVFVVEAATGTLLEIEGLDPCPVPQSDCHANPSQSQKYGYAPLPVIFQTTPGFPITAVLPTTFSSLTVSGLADTIEDVTCTVDVTHTFVGDLDVSLKSPTAITVQLHDSAGTDADDLLASFDDGGRPYGPPFGVGDTMRPSGPGTLADFDGIVGNGIWTLTVTDNFTGENGTLNAWALGLPTGIAVPDDDPAGLSAVLTVADTVLDSIADVDVVIEVGHADPSQLQVSVTSPSGTTVVLHDQTGAGSDLSVRYDDDPILGGLNDGFGTAIPSGPGVLADFDDEPVAGDWTLTVADLAVGTEGSLARWELLVCPLDCAPPTNVTCVSDCQTGDVTVSWSNPVSYAGIEVMRDGASIATIAGDATGYVDAAPAGQYQYTIVGTCDPAAAGSSCSVTHAPYTAETHVIFVGEHPAGATDSSAALVAALEANSVTPLVVDTLDYACLSELPSGSTLWVLLGTFPDNYTLDNTEGQTLVDLLDNDVSIYIEGADVWGFDDPTPFADYDGVENTTAEDGDNSFEGMVGLAHGALDLSDLAATYAQDQLTSSDFTDRLLATGTTPAQPVDIPAGTAGLIWQDDVELYGTGVYFETTDVGLVIAQSWEFGGYNGDRDELAARYLGIFGAAPPPPAFRRGDANLDGAVQISDAIFVLSYLFVPGSDSPGCFSSADVNDDGATEISDAVYLLSYLFVFGSPEPTAPFPNCGTDPTADALTCEFPTGC